MDPTRAPLPVEFRLLGPVAVCDANGEPLAVGSPRQRAVLAALLLHGGESLSVDQFVDLLWPGDAPRTAATMVHGAVAGLRRVLDGNRRGDAPQVLVTRDGGYTLQVAPEQVDAVRFERFMTAGRRLIDESPARASGLLADALGEWRSSALAGVEEHFARAAAARLEELRLQCVELHADAELRLGRQHDAVARLEGLVAAHPLRERLCAHLMLGLYRCGRQADALAAYSTLRRTLVDELGVEPASDLQRLQVSILRHGKELQLADRPVVAYRYAALPVPVSSFVGRDRERDEVSSLLAVHRLVTLTGTGGAGKTRLAVEVTRRLVDCGEVEAVLVDLTPVTTSPLVRETLADALGVRAEPGQGLSRAIGVALSARPVVIVLDNCEHLVAACADLVQSLLAASALVRVLATSREALGVPGEQVHAVQPLSTASPQESWDRIAACEAVQLFEARAAAVRPGFAVTEQNAALVLHVCRRVDGVPLAIELAAARAAALPLSELAGRLDDRFGLLESATRTADRRHRSLSAALDWSYDLLSQAEQSLFVRLAVFPAAFDLRAAEAVAADRALPPRDVALLLSRLVLCSMVQLEDEADGGTRYRLLETTRAYARERLDQAVRVVLDERHAARYLAVAQEAESRLFQVGSGPWLERLHAERDNLRAALRWCFGAGGDPGRGARLVGCLWHYWDLRGARDEGLHWVHNALATVGPSQPGRRMPLLSAGALLHLGRADFTATARLAAEQLTLARDVAHRAWEGDALAMLATIDWAHGRFDRAQQRYEDAVAASLAGDDLWRAAMAEAQLARLHRDRREPDAARAVARRSLAHAEAVGEELARGLALDVLASAEYRWGSDAEARRLVEDALAHYRLVHYREGEASALQLAGAIALRSHARGPARDAFRQSLDLCRRIGHRAGTAAALEGLAAVASTGGEQDEATELTRAAAALRAEIGVAGPTADQPPSTTISCDLAAD
jgi:predicted ATPase/DNA-binding SARP family transcriptional activator